MRPGPDAPLATRPDRRTLAFLFLKTTRRSITIGLPSCESRLLSLNVRFRTHRIKWLEWKNQAGKCCKVQLLEKKYLAGGRPRFKRALNSGSFLLLCGMISVFANFCPAANITEYGLPSGGTQPVTMTYGPDKFYWAAGFITDQILRINPTNGAVG